MDTYLYTTYNTIQLMVIIVVYNTVDILIVIYKCSKGIKVPHEINYHIHPDIDNELCDI